MKRSAGILMPISSLPSNYGIGTLGIEAYKFVDFLKQSKQTYWQILPISPISFGDSPYSSFSAFAGNPYYIDLDILVKEKLLKKSDINYYPNSKTKVNYEYLYNNRYSILYKAYKRGYEKYLKDINVFIRKNKWLKDYALYMAIKKHFNMLSWSDWPDQEIRKRNKYSISKYRKLLDDDIKFNYFMQFLFFKQFDKLKKYINKNGIKLIGDIPVYVSLDSADCWANPKCFKLDKNFIPKEVSGVPADEFTADGQLWGNPLYDWNYLKKNNYKWWIDRIKFASKIYDVIRIDHFRGFESYWTVPYGSKTARYGKWRKGPGESLTNEIKNKCKNIEFISEDLGYHTNEVQKLLDNFGYPGMKVLQFSFDSRDNELNRPHNYPVNSVCYTGTHDNTTINGWFCEAKRNDVDLAIKYGGLNRKEGLNWGMIRLGMSSQSKLFIAPIQDYLGSGSQTRINTPGTVGCNWKWRINKKEINKDLSKRIAQYTKYYDRCFN